LTPTPRATSPSKRTPTPELSPGPEPRIFAFAAAPDSSLKIGDKVRLTWEAQGERAELSWYNHHGQIEGWREVPLSGSTTVTLRDEDPVADQWVDFKLYVVRESGVYTYTEQRQRVTLVCRLSWFFSPSPDGCPIEEPQTTSLIGQHFEGGLILGDESHSRVFLNEEDQAGKQYLSFGLRRLPRVALSEEAVASGRLLPAPEFSGLWSGLFPGHEEFCDRVGWATGPAVSFESEWQCAMPEQAGPPRDCFQLGPEAEVLHVQIAGAPEAIWLDDKWPLSYARGTWRLWSGAEPDH
jgi:hypothetical protein